MPSYRFSDFSVSPQRRILLQGGREVPLIPKYFDLLVLLIERRHEAVHRREIFDRIWGDVIVSDTALNQAVRTIRRALGDDSREPRFIRTVSRHGYRFVFEDVIEVEHEAPAAVPEPAAGVVQQMSPATAAQIAVEVEASSTDPFEPLLARIAAPADAGTDEEDRREAAELLHALGTAEALHRLGTREGHTRARALLRDTRWDAPAADAVPVMGAPAGFAVAREVVALRVRRAARLVATRWESAAAGAGLAGAISGAVGGVLLAALPDSQAPLGAAAVLGVIGAGCGAAGGAGVGAGMALAEAIARSRRLAALIVGASLGGGLAGAAVEWISRWALVALFGLGPHIGGTFEGLIIGAAAGTGYAIATRRAQGGMAAPRGRKRLNAALLIAAMCGLAGFAVTLTGRPLVGGTVHAIARTATGSQVSLAPLGRMLGEPDFGPITQRIIGVAEAAVFGLGLAFGVTRRPRS